PNVPCQPAQVWRARYEEVHRRKKPLLDFSNRRIRALAELVEGIYLHAAHVRLRLHAIHRARRLAHVTRGRSRESGTLSQRDRNSRETRASVVGLNERFELCSSARR